MEASVDALKRLCAAPPDYSTDLIDRLLVPLASPPRRFDPTAARRLIEAQLLGPICLPSSIPPQRGFDRIESGSYSRAQLAFVEILRPITVAEVAGKSEMGWGVDFYRMLTTIGLLAKELLNLPFSVNMNTRDRTKSSAGRRDLALYINGLPFLQVEAKRNHGQLDEAIEDLRRKHRTLNHQYFPADIEFIFGMATAGSMCQVYIIGDGGNFAPISDISDITSLSARYQLLRITINILRWARGMSTQHYSAPGPPAFKDDDGHDVYFVDRIVRQGTGRNKNKYLVRWTGYGPEHDTWEPAHRLRELDAFKAFKGAR